MQDLKIEFNKISLNMSKPGLQPWQRLSDALFWLSGCQSYLPTLTWYHAHNDKAH